MRHTAYDVVHADQCYASIIREIEAEPNYKACDTFEEIEKLVDVNVLGDSEKYRDQWGVSALRAVQERVAATLKKRSDLYVVAYTDADDLGAMPICRDQFDTYRYVFADGQHGLLDLLANKGLDETEARREATRIEERLLADLLANRFPQGARLDVTSKHVGRIHFIVINGDQLAAYNDVDFNAESRWVWFVRKIHMTAEQVITEIRSYLYGELYDDQDIAGMSHLDVIRLLVNCN